MDKGLEQLTNSRRTTTLATALLGSLLLFPWHDYADINYHGVLWLFFICQVGAGALPGGGLARSLASAGMVPAFWYWLAYVHLPNKAAVSWWRVAGREIAGAVRAIWQEGPTAVGGEVRTLLLLLGLVMGASLLSWLAKGGRGWLLLVAGEAYLAAGGFFLPQLPWTTYQVLLLAGVLMFQALKGPYPGSGQRRAWVLLALTAPSLVLLLGSFVPPLPGGNWSLPRVAAPAAGVAVTGKVGYGDSDVLLGLPLQQDTTIIFTVRASQPAYWRGEAKDHYTGRGWLANGGQVTVNNRGRFGDGAEDGLPVLEQEFVFRQVSPRVLLAAYPAVRLVEPRLNVLVNRQDNLLLIEPLPAGSSYTLLSQPTSFSGEELQQSGIAYPEEVRSYYLSLPARLPERVGRLAREVTAGAANPYDQLKLLENFLRSSYRYSTTDVNPPPMGEDFVDHFLFEQQAGYCDHFSSALVVMGRTLGIPGRWVKGFLPGEAVEEEAGTYLFTVRNSNAHSWAEFYFPGTGWVPWEPTPAFALPAAMGGAQLLLEEEEELVPAGEEEAEGDNKLQDTQGLWPWWAVWAGGLVMAIWLCYRFKAGRPERVFVGGVDGACLWLARGLEPRLRRQVGETGREWARRLAGIPGIDQASLWRLVQLYEKTVFGGRAVSHEDAVEAWQVARQVKNSLEGSWQGASPASVSDSETGGA